MDQPLTLQDELKHNPELAMMLLTPPVCFNPIYSYITDSVSAALMLSVFTDQTSELHTTADGWFIIDEADFTFFTSMSPAEQKSARAVLRAKNLVSERTVDSQLQMFVDFQKITNAIIMFARQRNSRTTQTPLQTH